MTLFLFQCSHYEDCLARRLKPFIRQRRRRRSEAWRRTSGSIAILTCRWGSFKVLIGCHRQGNQSAAPTTDKKFQFGDFKSQSKTRKLWIQLATTTPLSKWVPVSGCYSIPTNLPISTELSAVGWHCCRRLLKRQKQCLPRRSERWVEGRLGRAEGEQFAQETWTTCLASGQEPRFNLWHIGNVFFTYHFAMCRMQTFPNIVCRWKRYRNLDNALLLGKRICDGLDFIQPFDSIDKESFCCWWVFVVKTTISAYSSDAAT